METILGGWENRQFAYNTMNPINLLFESYSLFAFRNSAILSPSTDAPGKCPGVPDCAGFISVS
jgi:hypothetical protein